MVVLEAPPDHHDTAAPADCAEITPLHLEALPANPLPQEPPTANTWTDEAPPAATAADKTAASAPAAQPTEIGRPADTNEPTTRDTTGAALEGKEREPQRATEDINTTHENNNNNSELLGFRQVIGNATSLWFCDVAGRNLTRINLMS